MYQTIRVSGAILLERWPVSVVHISRSFLDLLRWPLTTFVRVFEHEG